MILVTGGGGFVGVNAARCLADKGEEVMLLQRRSRGVPPLLEQYWGKQVREATGSILELPFLFGLMKEFPIDGIVHAAFDSAGIDARGGGMSPSSGRTLYDVVQIGINGTINMLELGRLFALRRIIFISSVDTYQGMAGGLPGLARRRSAAARLLFSHRQQQKGRRTSLLPLCESLRTQRGKPPRGKSLRSRGDAQRACQDHGGERGRGKPDRSFERAFRQSRPYGVRPRRRARHLPRRSRRLTERTYLQRRGRPEPDDGRGRRDREGHGARRPHHSGCAHRGKAVAYGGGRFPDRGRMGARASKCSGRHRGIRGVAAQGALRVASKGAP